MYGLRSVSPRSLLASLVSSASSASIALLPPIITAIIASGCNASAQPTAGPNSGGNATAPISDQAPIQTGDPFVPTNLIEENRVIANPSTASAVRTDLAALTLRAQGAVLPRLTVTTEPIASHPLIDVGALGAAYKITTTSQPEWSSVAYLFVPKVHGSGVVIFHEGHLTGGSGNDVEQQNDQDVIQGFLAQGLAVAFVNMPLMGDNPRAVTIVHPRLGTLNLRDHTQFAMLEGFENTIAPFIEPLRAVHETVTGIFPGEPVCLLGLSGGGWTVTVYAASQPTVTCAVAVAGSLPSSMHTAATGEAKLGDIGDYEQNQPTLLTRANYTEMYTLAALEPGRVFEQVMIANDPCCFAQSDVPAFASDISGFLQSIGGGDYRVTIDQDSQDHIVGAIAQTHVVDLLQAQGGRLIQPLNAPPSAKADKAAATHRRTRG